MSDTITPEERARLRSAAATAELCCLTSIPSLPPSKVTDILNALEQTEAQLAAALQVNTKSQAEVTADMLNAMMAGITGQKETVHVQVGGYQCPYCNEISKTIEAATEHDAICPKHPAVMRAEKSEAEVARLTKMVDWLAELVFDRPCAYACCPFDKHRPTGPDDDDCDKTHIQCWAEAASRAVAAGEE